jgi:eukaryotic-like serine/threonine-protein kinase
MDLAAGTKLGPYEVVGPIGAGGMGEVYRARDTRLDRCVALKILPAHFSCSPELKSRFEREARTLSSVSHPHICHLYDVGSQSGTDFLVMELLEGDTLGARLRKGPLAPGEVLKIGLEIADALASAHRLGLVHRDLKPSNIMLTKTGAKLMDFGLAKPAVNPLSAANGTSPVVSAETLTTMHSPGSPITAAGAIVGTIQYMAPEQLEGREADARSDLFAFGAVLYEMATGRRAFEGKSYMSVASAILHKEPAPVNTVQPTSPAGLNYIIATCLAKDPDERFQTAHDIKLQLSWLIQPGSNIAAPAKTETRRRMYFIASSLLVFGLLAGLALSKFSARAADPARDVLRLTVPLPPKQELSADTTMSLAISPDGKRLAYVAAESGVSRLYTRRLDQFEPVAIPDSEGAWFPFFSPNGDWVAFFSQGKLKKAPSDGGVPVIVAEMPSFFGGTWTPQNLIVVSVPNMGLATVPATGGTLHKVPLATKDLVYPQGLAWIAGGDWVVFSDFLAPRRRMVAVKLSSGEVRSLLEDATSPSFSAGHLLYFQGGAVWAVPFDSGKVQITGDAAQLESGVDEQNYVAQVTAARDHVLAYAPGLPGNSARNLFLVDRKGQEKKLDLPPKDYIDPAFSPDGKRIAVVIRSVQQLEIIDRDGAAVTNLATNFANFAPVWMPDGKSLLLDVSRSYLSADPADQRGIYRLPVDGSSEPQRLRTTRQISHVTSIGGDYAAVMVSDPATNTEIWLLGLHQPYDMRPFKQTPAVERQGSLSPDGRWIAYVSNESGHSEVYVEPVPGPGGRRQVSVEGGDQPRWVRSGREITYRNGTRMMSVPVQIQPTFQSGKAIELFDRKFDPGAAVPGYDVSPDGQTFIMTRSEHDNPTQIRVVVNWRAGKQEQK